MARAFQLRTLAADTRGTSFVEFGMLAPVLALLVMGIIDLSTALSDRFTIQQAANRSLELLQARPVVADDDGDVDYSFVKAEAADAAGVPETQVTLTQWLECDGVADDGDDSCADDEDAARYLRVRITKNFQGRFLLGTTPMAASGALRIQ